MLFEVVLAQEVIETSEALSVMSTVVSKHEGHDTDSPETVGTFSTFKLSHEAKLWTQNDIGSYLPIFAHS